MSYNIQLSNEARKSFRKLPQRIKNKVNNQIFLLAVNPLLGEPLSGKFKGAYKIYVWPYRILYRVYHKELCILIMRIRHRQSSYK